jgi:hypothetical protein
VGGTGCDHDDLRARGHTIEAQETAGIQCIGPSSKQETNSGSNTIEYRAGFVIGSGAILGVGASFLWVAQGAIMTTYVPESQTRCGFATGHTIEAQETAGIQCIGPSSKQETNSGSSA